MTDAEKIAQLRAALAPFADLLEDPAGFMQDTFEATVTVSDVCKAKDAMNDTQ